MSEKFMSGIEEGRLDKLENEACLLLYFANTLSKIGDYNFWINNHA